MKELKIMIALVALTVISTIEMNAQVSAEKKSCRMTVLAPDEANIQCLGEGFTCDNVFNCFDFFANL